MLSLGDLPRLYISTLTLLYRPGICLSCNRKDNRYFRPTNSTRRFTSALFTQLPLESSFDHYQFPRDENQTRARLRRAKPERTRIHSSPRGRLNREILLRDDRWILALA